MTWDLRSRGVSVDDIGGAVSFGEAIDLLQVARQLEGTLTHAEMHGWGWPATPADLVAIEHAEWYMNAHRRADAGWIRVPRPWDKPEKVETVSPDELAALTARLQASTVWASEL